MEVVCRPEHVRRTATIALCVGLFLNVVNQGAEILHGEATTGTWLRVGLNFVVPFVVSNAGLVSRRWAEISRRGDRRG